MSGHIGTRFNEFLNGSSSFPLVLEIDPPEEEHGPPPAIKFFYVGHDHLVGTETTRGGRMVCPLGGNWFISVPGLQEKVQRAVYRAHRKAEKGELEYPTEQRTVQRRKLTKKPKGTLPRRKPKKRPTQAHAKPASAPKAQLKRRPLTKRKKPTIRKRPTK